MIYICADGWQTSSGVGSYGACPRKVGSTFPSTTGNRCRCNIPESGDDKSPTEPQKVGNAEHITQVSRNTDKIECNSVV